MKHLFLILLLVGCDLEAADIATEEPIDLPDLTGRFQVSVFDVEGCAPALDDLEWMVGQLEITGEPGSLSLEFVGGDVLLGSIDETFALDAEGTVQPMEREQDAVFQGIVVLGDLGWDLDGDVVADVIDSTDDTVACTLTARLEAKQSL